MIRWQNCLAVFWLVYLIALLFLPIVTFAQEAQQQAVSSSKKLIGWTERVALSGTDLVLYGQMEPSTQSTMLHLQKGSLSLSERSKDEVSFELEDRFGAKHNFELPVVRKSRLRSPSGKTRQVYVVTLSFCLAGKFIEEEVILSERENIEHEIYIGRQALEGLFTIDPSQQFSSNPDCTEETIRKKK